MITESSQGQHCGFIQGACLDLDGVLADVEYDLQVLQEQLDAGGGERIPGMKTIGGRFSLISRPLPPTETLTLHMEDGSKLAFFMVSSNCFQGSGAIF